MKFPFSGKSKLEAQLKEATEKYVAEKEAVVKLTAELEALKLQAPEAKEVIKEVIKEVQVPTVPTEITDKLAALEKENATFKAELEVAKKAVVDFELAVAVKAQDKLAEIGVEKLPVVPEDKTKEEIFAHYASIKNLAEQRKFYERNYSVLKGM